MNKSLVSNTLAIVFLLLMTNSGHAQDTAGSWLNGTWEGTGYQMDTNETWTMRLKVRRNRYSIEYPSLNCGGRWKVLSINSWQANFRESILYGRNECIDEGRVVVQRLGNGQIAYRFYNRGAARVTASAILNRRPVK
jgi:hypothetical protein